jgi:hypothetical protein
MTIKERYCPAIRQKHIRANAGYPYFIRCPKGPGVQKNEKNRDGKK